MRRREDVVEAWILLVTWSAARPSVRWPDAPRAGTSPRRRLDLRRSEQCAAQRELAGSRRDRKTG